MKLPVVKKLVNINIPSQSLEDLTLRLGSAEMRRLSSQYFRERILDLPLLIFSCVDRSTIRAYRNTQRFAPLSIFRSWAYQETSVKWFAELEVASLGHDSYRAFHDETCLRLQHYWAECEREELGQRDDWPASVPNYGRSRKLVDLLMKHILLLEFLDDDVRERLRFLVHVPLDKFTLKHLSGVSRAEGIALPPSKWTMGTVNETNYLPLQDLIRRTAVKAAIAPIDFDIYAWNAEHIQTGNQPPPSDVSSRLGLIGKSKTVDWKWLGRRRRAAALLLSRGDRS